MIQGWTQMVVLVKMIDLSANKLKHSVLIDTFAIINNMTSGFADRYPINSLLHRRLRVRHARRALRRTGGYPINGGE